MQQLFEMAQGSVNRFPDGFEPFQIVTRLLEECGEVAAEVDHWEDSGVKQRKYGRPKKERLADELRQAMNALLQLAMYDHVERQLQQAVELSIAGAADGLLPGQLTLYIPTVSWILGSGCCAVRRRWLITAAMIWMPRVIIKIPAVWIFRNSSGRAGTAIGPAGSRSGFTPI